jgi:hypothetical protein
VVQEFITILSSKTEDCYWITVADVLYVAVTYKHRILDMVSLVRVCQCLCLILQCDRYSEHPGAILAFTRTLGGLSAEERRQIPSRQLWPLLIFLRSNPLANFRRAGDEIMAILLKNSAGMYYAEFLEDGLFEQLVQRLRQPSSTIVEIPLSSDRQRISVHFKALECDWFAVLRYSAFLLSSSFLSP